MCVSLGWPSSWTRSRYIIIYLIRSTLEPLAKSSMNLTVVKATLEVKASANKDYQPFATECNTMTKSLTGFIERAHAVCAEADACDASVDDKKMQTLVGEIKNQTITAEHHKIGADSARTRYNAILNVAAK